MPCVPVSLSELLVLFASCFTAPSFRTFQGLVVGQVSQTGLRTVTGMLVGSRLSGVWHHSRAHRFFSYARWSVDELGLRLAVLIVERLCDPGGEVLVAVDDTLLRRRGRKVHGCFWHHDATANSAQTSVAWGNNWIVAGVVVRLPFLERSVCLPVLFRLWQPRRKHLGNGEPDPERPAKPELARELVDLLAARLPARRIHVVGDAAYATEAWRGLPGPITITSRLRSNAALYAPAPEPTGRRGRPRKWGQRLGTLAQIAVDPATRWEDHDVCRYGKTETLTLAVVECLWGPLGPDTPARAVIVHDPSKQSGYQISLITTDPDASPDKIIERYADRWPIEVAFEEAKELFGAGHARNRTRRAVERTVPFQFMTMTLTIIWYAASGHHPQDVADHRQRAPWYLTKKAPSLADMHAKLRRVIIAAQYHPGQARTSTPREISRVQEAWAAAGL